jgi:transposase InsO family protein
MSLLSIWLKALWHCARTICRVLFDLVGLLRVATKSRTSLVAENLFLRKQLAMFQERNVRPHRAQDSARWLMACLSRLFAWRDALVVVEPDTLNRWHRKGFRLFWRWKSKPAGRPSVPKNLQELIRKMAAENPTWGEEHIANELKLKLGFRLSPRTVQKYLASHRGRTPDPSQRWLTFVRNHAQAMVACDFFVVFTARFRILYVLVIMEMGRRQILHHNVTAHPTAAWTLQQFRETLIEEHPYRFLIHDRDSIFSKDLDRAVTAMGVRILKTPMRAPKANAFCERLVGTIRRECLDFLIPLGERHLKRLLTQWVAYYNHARVHSSLGPGVPDPIRPSPPMSGHRHRLPAGYVLRRKAVLGGLHHEYWLEKVAA